ncbi:GTPase Der [Candidatus Gullanella endobia]|uniref:GTPase Der n=1 Tax=Candidatus Gullanella endobia TaxID=1070130 RepID=A0A143WPV6_9ENTR|nr:ribosome biogenesis GTPase Der [Candidatus Gullanella endobia]CUX95723.1 GTPase Der [Candidatus Gullanella endobia]
MIPIIAIIGRQNVGKSTLFNQLTKTRDALVGDFCGLTRDRKYGYAKWDGYEFIVIDTGGINNNKGEIETHIISQSLVAIEEADIILFMVDGRTGLIADDEVIAKNLRNRDKIIIIIVNKTDGINIDSAVGDFYSLGIKEIIPISASHGRGINSMLEKVFLLLINNDFMVIKEKKETELLSLKEKNQNLNYQSLPIKLAIVGRPNVGKSTLINHVLGEERVIVYDLPGSTRDSIYIQKMRDEKEYILIDTVGVRKRGRVKETIEKFSVIKTFQAIKDANVVLLLINACEDISNEDLSLLGFILKSGRSLVIAINKWDALSNETRKKMKEALYHRLTFINFVRIHFISALHGNGIGNLFKSVNEAYQCATKRINAALLTRIMHMAVDKHQLPLVRGRHIKLKYAHSGGYNPPTIVIHGKLVKDLPETYKRYLINYFQHSLEIIGTPIRIRFNETESSFSKR